MFKILPDYGDTLSSLCPVNSNCSWGSAVNVRNKFIYITQPEQNRVVVVEIQDRSNPVEVPPSFPSHCCADFARRIPNRPKTTQ